MPFQNKGLQCPFDFASRFWGRRNRRLKGIFTGKESIFKRLVRFVGQRAQGLFASLLCLSVASAYCFPIGSLVVIQMVSSFWSAAKMRHMLLFALVFSVIGCSEPDGSKSLSEEGINEIDSFLQAKVNEGAIPGVVAIVANKDQTLYHDAYGKLDAANDVAMPEDAIFHVASMVKPITSVAIMMLLEEGKIELDDPISKYLSAWLEPKVIDQFNETDSTFSIRSASSEITIRQLLAHTSGLGYNFSNDTLTMIREKTGESVQETHLLHDPGSRWTYGMSTRLLGDLISEVTDRHFKEFFQERIFDPLGMVDTYYEVPEEKYSRHVTLHRRVDGDLKENAEKDRFVFIAGDGGLRSTASDYIKFLQMLLNGGQLNNTEFLSPSSVNQMIQNQIGDLVVINQPGAEPPVSLDFPLGAGEDKFGLGFQLAAIEKAGQRGIGSYSWSGLFNTHFWGDPNNDIAVIVLMQVLPFYDEECISVLQGLKVGFTVIWNNFLPAGVMRN